MSGSSPAVPVVFGEVLFDCFSDGTRVLGGAPFNVAWHLQAFGASPWFVSRVGRDDAGEAVATAMERWGMTLDGLQRDPAHSTGVVRVHIEDGDPRYEIAEDSAWDHIDAEALPEVAARVVYHGTLARRSEPSARALDALCAGSAAPVFVDVNLRPPWWERDAVQAVLARADLVKLNAEELDALAPGSGSLLARARDFRRRHGLRWLVVTRGAEGALAVDAREDVHEVAPAASTRVVDTVGAGDAFAAVLLLGVLRGWPLPLALERGQAFASRVVGLRGATTDDRGLYRDMARAWDLEAPAREGD